MGIAQRNGSYSQSIFIEFLIFIAQAESSSVRGIGYRVPSAPHSVPWVPDTGFMSLDAQDQLTYIENAEDVELDETGEPKLINADVLRGKVFVPRPSPLFIWHIRSLYFMFSYPLTHLRHALMDHEEQEVLSAFDVLILADRDGNLVPGVEILEKLEEETRVAFEGV
jgi:hypothetical protein